MTGDSWMVLALMLGFWGMVGVGVVARLQDDTRDALRREAGRLAVGLGAVLGLLFVVSTA